MTLISIFSSNCLPEALSNAEKEKEDMTVTKLM